MNIYRSTTLSMEFATLESADDWIDAIIEEFDGEYDTVNTSIRGGGGTYEATVEFFRNTNGTSTVSEGNREPDLFDPIGG